MGKNVVDLQALANWLLNKQEAILEEWEKQMKQRDGAPTQLAAMSREEFLNSIPNFLDHLSDSLKGRDISFRAIGKEHGSQRWEHGFDLTMTIQEWGVLQKVIENKVISFWQQYDIPDYSSVNKSHKILSTHIQQGIEFSIEEFNQLQQMESEAQLRDLKLALEKPEEMLRKHNLRGASHDLKGIMYSLQVGFKLLQDEDLNHNASEIIDQMKEGADDLEQLLNDLLDLFRLETNQEEVTLSEFDVAEMLAKLCESMQPMAKSEKLQLTYQGIDFLRVKSDKNKVQRIARNLLLNALKYTNQGYVKIGCEPITDDQWLLEVSDTGPGLDATHAKSLSINADSSETERQNNYSLNNNRSSKADSHGEGIGLLIVRHLCRLLDASIEIKTKSGEGTTFQIVFPFVINYNKE